MRKVIPWILGISGLLAGILNVKLMVVCFYIWGLECLAWIFYILYYKDKAYYGQIPMWATYVLLNIWGIMQWTK